MSGDGRNLIAPGPLVLATHNAGKLAEINDLISPFGFEAQSAADHGLAEPIEDGSSFEDNAAIKALSAARGTGKVALSDDSGLCVDALDGAPGIHTADWAETGSGRDFGKAMAMVEERLQAIGATDDAQRTGRFVAVLCLAWPDGHCEFFRGEAPGVLIWPPRGALGFGYDPVFRPDGHTRTFGEMSASEKHGWVPGGGMPLSHRARAFALFASRKLGT